MKIDEYRQGWYINRAGEREGGTGAIQVLRHVPKPLPSAWGSNLAKQSSIGVDRWDTCLKTVYGEGTRADVYWGSCLSPHLGGMALLALVPKV